MAPVTCFASVCVRSICRATTLSASASVPDSSPLALKAGDVILTVGDRKPNTVSKLLGILQTYDDGESVTLDVMREHKHVTVTGKADWSQPHFLPDGAPERGQMKIRTDQRD